MRLFWGRLRTPPRSPQPGPSPATRPHKREKIRPARLHQCPRAKKFAQHRPNCPKSALFRLQGELFRGFFQNPLLLGEFFAPMGATATSQHPPTASPETNDTNAGGSLPPNETTDTSAISLAHTFETADTFARTKQPISGRFPPAKASPVSLSLPQLPQGARLVTRAPTCRSRAARWTSHPRPCAT